MKIYLDLDGFLADLFSAISFRFFNKPYKDITPEEKAEAKKIWYDREHFIQNFGDVEEFFANLPPFGEHGELTKAIIDTVVKIAGGYSICSCPAGIDRAASEAGKREWIQKHLHPAPDEMQFITNKTQVAKDENGKPNVLIDDFPKYIKAWRAAGGIAIEMRTDSFNSTSQVREFLTKELQAAKEQIDGKQQTFEQYVNDVLSRLL